ncbi:hypothetical protein [Rhodopseudomonas pseudopalustris]|uniref:Uncharacterized protein n=1 Tax=Rhodopseudomonas pseudopalustris TaxID=1513892 RepID=A0A1H8LVH1_9BRAD|nr:hypothetical protein [Rhodopseudomonas pseudopalustris]SEO08876.1 hypothetical protein SAMN05444123_101233 [Rhodopseudomonas pseudopalustris]
MLTTSLREWLVKVGWKIGLVVALAAALALGTNGTLSSAFRYLAGFGGLSSIVQAGLAVGRGRPLVGRLSEWHEAIVLSVLSAVSHLIAVHIDAIT